MMKDSKPDDVTLIRRIAQAQAEAISELYDRYKRLVFSIAFAVVGDRAVAEEVTLDVFVQVWRKAGSYLPERGKVSTWLIAITRNHAIDVLRWQNSHPETDGIVWDEISLPDGQGTHELEDGMEFSTERERVRRAVSQLPEDQSQAVAMAYFKGYTQSQIAHALKQPLGTIKTRIRLAMQKLRKLLDEDQQM